MSNQLESDDPAPKARQAIPALDMARTEAFIRANTRLLNPPLTPEIRLHLAEESLPIWQKTEDELGEMNVPPPFWAFAWAGGQAVARYILDTPDVAAGRSALDLGAGSGIGAIAAKLSGASDALAADIDRFAVVAASLNAAANGVALRITRDDLLLAPPPEAGLVVVADMFYEKDMAEQVLEFCVASARRGAVVLVGDPQRNYFPRDRFHEVASYSVPVTRELEDSEIKRTAVWRLTD